MNIPDAAIGAIVASLIGGTVVFISTILSKEQKTSEFRQAWVDALRDDLAEYVAGVAELISLAAFYADEVNDEKTFIIQNHERMAHLRSLGTRIQLRLNPEEHQSLYGLVQHYVKRMIEEYEENDEKGEADKDSAHEKAILQESQAVLKAEWRRVKSGEAAFRLTKYMALVMLALALIALIIAIFSTLDTRHQVLQPMPSAFAKTYLHI